MDASGDLSLFLRLDTLALSCMKPSARPPDYPVAHVDDIVHMSVTEMADAAGTSQARVLRRARTFG